MDAINHAPCLRFHLMEHLKTCLCESGEISLHRQRAGETISPLFLVV